MSMNETAKMSHKPNCPFPKRNSGKLSISVVVGLLLGGCALVGGSTAFSGNSTTFGGNNALRDDVLKNIAVVERSVHGCNRIDRVHAEIRNIHSKGEVKIEELWTVEACGERRSHPVTLRPVPGGGTVISTSVPPMK